MNKQALFKHAAERIIKQVDLTEFHERFVNEDGSPIVLEVWVNPFNADMNKRLEGIAETNDEERGTQRVGLMLGMDPTEIHQLFDGDAPFAAWLSTRVMRLFMEYQTGNEKKSSTG